MAHCLSKTRGPLPTSKPFRGRAASLAPKRFSKSAGGEGLPAPPKPGIPLLRTGCCIFTALRPVRERAKANTTGQARVRRHSRSHGPTARCYAFHPGPGSCPGPSARPKAGPPKSWCPFLFSVCLSIWSSVCLSARLQHAPPPPPLHRQCSQAAPLPE